MSVFLPDQSSQKVILVFPDYRNGEVFENVGLPVGLGYISRALEVAGIEHQVVDLNFETFASLINSIRAFKPSCLGVSMMSYRCKRVYRWLKNIKTEFPNLVIVAGGPHVAANREQILKECPEIDFAVVGEGESAFIELMRGVPPSLVKGILFRDGEQVLFSGEREFITDLDDVPFPTYAKFKLERYDSMMVINSSRGCPYKCVFCGAPRILGKKWRARSANGMFAEVRYWHGKGYGSFCITDSNFAVDKRRVSSFCDLVIKNKLGVTFAADGLRADHFDSPLLLKLKEAGFTSLTFGVESGSEKVLRNLKKGEALGKIKSTIAEACKLGFNVTLFFLIGSPGEGAADIKRSFRLARKYNVSRVYFFYLTPIPGTEFFDWAIAQGHLKDSDERYPENNFAFETRASRPTDVLSRDQLTRWIGRARQLERRIETRHSIQRKLSKTRLGRLLAGIGMIDSVSWLLSHPVAMQRDRRAVLRASGNPNLFEIRTHMTERERLFLYQLARSLQHNACIVEMGSYLGASASFLAAGARVCGGKVHAVDTWTNIGMTEGQRDTYAEFMQNIEPARQWIEVHRGGSVEVAKSFDRQIDLLFVDGDHSYEGARADLEAWLPKMKPRGIVICHDFNWAEGVQRAVREMIVPIQCEGGRRVDSIYWTRIGQQRPPTELAASVIVPTYSRPAMLKEAVESLQAQKFEGGEYEILVVDNGPTGEAETIVAELNQTGRHPVRYVREPHVGLHNARHAGARAARSDILVYVDDDVIAPPGWLAAAVATFSDPKIGCVGGKSLPQWETERPAWWSQFTDDYLSLLNYGDKTKELHWPEAVYGCNMAVRRSVLYEVGGFNPDAMGDRRLIWHRGDGETGLHEKIYDAGYKVIYNPDAWLYHQIPAARLTPQAMCRRGFLGGLSMSFTAIRMTQGRRLFGLRLLRRAVRAFLRAGICVGRAMRHKQSKVRFMADAWLWYGYSGQHLRAIFNPRLRRYLLRDTYL